MRMNDSIPQKYSSRRFLIFTGLSILCDLALRGADAASNGSRKGQEHAGLLTPVDATERKRLILIDRPVQIRLNVDPIKQPSTMSCWATVYAMMRSWKVGRSISIDDAIAELGSPFTSYLAENRGLPGGSELKFVNAAGLRAKPPASYPLLVFRELLRDKGPVWVVTGDGINSHARLLVGIYGFDAAEKFKTYQETTMEFIDPISGSYVYEPSLKFFSVFEREAAFIVNNGYSALDLRWQVITY